MCLARLQSVPCCFAGIVLQRHYGYKFCSPSRSAFLSGRLPYHVNQGQPQDMLSDGGVDIRMSTVANQFQRAGWETHQVSGRHRNYFPLLLSFRGCCVQAAASTNTIGLLPTLLYFKDRQVACWGPLTCAAANSQRVQHVARLSERRGKPLHTNGQWRPHACIHRSCCMCATMQVRHSALHAMRVMFLALSFQPASHQACHPTN